jgi:hypothetical protein
MFAEETLNDSMLTLMEGFRGSLPTDEACKLDGTIEFLRNTSTLVNIFKDKRPMEKGNDPRLQESKCVLQWFKRWEDSAKSKNDLMSSECLEDLAWLITGFKYFVDIMTANAVPIPPADINSDIIENFFCSQRGIQGGSKTNPPMHSYLYNINSIVLGQSTISTKSNTGGRGKAAEPYKYTTPVYVNKKSRKRKMCSE